MVLYNEVEDISQLELHINIVDGAYNFKGLLQHGIIKVRQKSFYFPFAENNIFCRDKMFSSPSILVLDFSYKLLMQRVIEKPALIF
jgi:hypothetical protein